MLASVGGESTAVAGDDAAAQRVLRPKGHALRRIPFDREAFKASCFVRQRAEPRKSRDAIAKMESKSKCVGIKFRHERMAVRLQYRV